MAMKEYEPVTSFIKTVCKSLEKSAEHKKANAQLVPSGMQKAMTPDEICARIATDAQRLAALEKKVNAAIAAGKEAKSAAENAKGVRATFGLFEGKDKAQLVITELHSADDAQVEAISTLSEAQKQILDYQTDIARILQGLFMLGCANLAQNRTVVRELELRLKGASEAEIGELARKELQGIINQLNQQRDILERQDQLGRNQLEQQKNIAANAAMISEGKKVAEIQQTEIERQAKKDEEHDRLIAANLSAIQKNRAEIERLVQEAKEIAHSIDSMAESVKKNFAEDLGRDEKIELLSKRVDALACKKFKWVNFGAIVIAVVALIVALLK